MRRDWTNLYDAIYNGEKLNRDQTLLLHVVSSNLLHIAICAENLHIYRMAENNKLLQNDQ